MKPWSLRRAAAVAAMASVAVVAVAALVWRSDILQALLDPKIPYPVYDPPPAPDYDGPAAWALREATLGAGGDASVFFVHATAYVGGREWNAPPDDPVAERFLQRVILPNYAAPFGRAGPVSAPRYREASLYTRLTIRQDAREARAFAYADIARAFETWLRARADGPIVLVGVEQGGELADRLLTERIAPDPALRRRLVAAYLVQTTVPEDRPGVAPCDRPDQTGCLVAYVAIPEDESGRLDRLRKRALTWDARGRLVEVGDRSLLCVNPLAGGRTEALVEARQHRGAANASQVEGGVRPAFLDRQVAAQCRDGLLRHTRPASDSFRPAGGWADRRKVSPYNLFYADLEHDVKIRLAAWRAAQPR
ncbi:MAG: DUF3089 domain-containing protein [Brevundimonas sp.]